MLRFEDLPEVNSERWLSLEDLEGEEWRDVVGYEGYYKISNYGRLKALDRYQENKWGKFLRKMRIRNNCKRNRQGYYSAALVKDIPNQSCTELISRIVAKAFIPNPENKRIVDHINTNVADNRVCNLRWTTDYENAHNPITEKHVRAFHDKRKGTHYSEETRKKISERLKNGRSSFFRMKGEEHYRSIPIVQLSLDGELVKEWSCAREASLIYGAHITDCCRGKRKQCGGFKWKYKSDYKE